MAVPLRVVRLLRPRRGHTYAAHTTPSGRRVFIMGLDTLAEPWLN
jgi:hypothetical protein